MSQTYSPEAPPTSRTRILLLIVWAVLTTVALGFVIQFGTNAPYADEWEFVPALLGAEPAGPWLWQQHNEHRMLLSRLIYYPLFQITHDFRAGMLLQVAMLSALSLGLMSLAAKLRGQPAWPDAFFPVSLLHLGHWENFIMGYQICFALFTVLVTSLVVVALQATRETAFSSGLRAGVLALLVALTGGSGLVVMLPVVAWIIYLAVIVARDGEKGRALTLVLLALLPVAYIGLYFVGYQRPPGHEPPSHDPIAVVPVAGEVLAMGLGIGVSGIWWMVFAVELILSVATVVLLFRQNREDRTSALGLIAVAVGVCGVALAIGVGRAPMGLDGLWSRYAFLAWPLLGTIYLVWVKARRKWVPVLLCVAAAIAFQTNNLTGVVFGSRIRTHYDQVENDSIRRVPAELIVERNFPGSSNSGQRERAVRGIPMLQAANIGIFATDETAGETNWEWLLAGLGGTVFLVFAVRWGWHLGRAVLTERARELFRLQHERFEEQLLKAAAATGLPRGLRWAKCQITGDAVLARDIAHGGIVALVPVVVQFEPEAGSDMEDNPMAREPRPSTAVFAFHRGTWTTTGRVVFNHTPEQTIAAFANQFRVIPHGHH